jgi:predicted ATP-grasp superfamily ATP-dependent carboligase
MSTDLRQPWLVAAWPGMGGVATIAGSFLARGLDADPFLEMEAQQFFEPRSVFVKGGLTQAGTLPKTVFHLRRDPSGARDLLILLAEQQPPDAHRQARALAEIAVSHGVERVVTFAAMATPIHPSASPRVFGVATRAGLLDELRKLGVTPLEDGEISGLNGTFLAAAAERGIDAVCLLGEFPFFAAQVPNPKASAAVLEVFGRMAGVALDLEPLRSDAAKVEEQLIHHLEMLQQVGEPEDDGAEGASTPESGGDEAEPSGTPPSGERPVPKEVLDRIDALFGQAREHREKALELKTELDRHGLFKRYEDRFLDLFKKAG